MQAKGAKFEVASPNIKWLFAQAQFISGDSLVELQVFCGQDWGIGQSTDEAREQANKVIAEVEVAVIEAGLEVRKGSYEP